MVLTLSESDIAKVLTYEALIPAMERALAAFSAGRVIQPISDVLTIEEGKRFLSIMPAVVEYGMGVKLVCSYPKNAGSRFPTHLSMIMLLEPETGQPLALLDGRLIAEMRTAAASAAVTQHIGPSNAKILSLVGSGAQAVAHLKALRVANDFDEVRVWSRTPEHARRFAEQHGAKSMELEAAVRGADIIVTTTSSTFPLVQGAWLKAGAHVNAVGALPNGRELDDAVMQNILIVDSRDAVLHGSGDVVLSNASIFAEAGEIFSGLKSVPRTTTTVFKSAGIAAQDIAAARLVYDAVARAGDLEQAVRARLGGSQAVRASLDTGGCHFGKANGDELTDQLTEMSGRLFR